MTLFVYVDGVDVSGRIRLEDGIQSMTSAADGTFGESGLRLDDPDGTHTYTQWSQVVINETACTPPRCFTGYVVAAHIERGPYKVGAGRIWVLDLVDLNPLLHVRILRAGTSARNLESGDTRMAWLLGSAALSGLVYNNGLVGTNPWMFDEANYVKSYGDDVLQDLCVSSSGDIGRIFFVYWDHTAGQASLFYDVPTAVVNTSTLALSNVLSDVNETTTFWAYVSPAIDREGEDIYCGVLFGYKGSYLYLHDQTTHTAHFANLPANFHREALFETDRVGSAATALRHAQQFLDAHSGQRDTIVCTVRLPASKVNLIEAGQRIAVRFNHVPGFETTAWTRVARRTFTFTPGTNEYYDVQLTLSVKGIFGLGSGDPGAFPHVVSTASIIQSSSGLNDRTFASPITAGSTLIYIGARRDAQISQAVGAALETYTLGPAGHTTNAPAALTPHYMAVFYKVATGAESQTLTVGTTGGSPGTKVGGSWLEVSGTVTPGTRAENTGTGDGTLQSTTAITAATGALVLEGAIWGEGGGFDSAINAAGSANYTAGASWTEMADVHPNGGGEGAPAIFTAYHLGGGSISGAATPTALGVANIGYEWAMQVISFVGTASDSPPATGQWVYDEIPTPVADGTTTTFTLAYKFADGSLLVKVDRLDQTLAVTSYDGAAKTFTLGFAPKTGEKIEVTYQGR